MTGTIRLGFEVGSGTPVDIPVRHMAVSGQTQESGKTTTLDAARLEAAQMEHDRLARERLAAAAVLREATATTTRALLVILRAVEEATTAVQTLRGVDQHFRDGDWIKPPRAMAAERASGNGEPGRGREAPTTEEGR